MRGTITKRSDGRYMGVVDLPKSADGKRKRQYIYDTDPRKLQIKINDLVYQIQNNIYRNPGKATIKDLCNEWTDNFIGKLAETTQALYKMYADKYIIPGIGGIKLKELLPADIEKYYLSLSVSGNTIRKINTFLNSILELAIKNNLILVNPCSKVNIPKKTKYKPKILTDTQFNTLFTSVSGVDKIIIMLAGLVGLRRGEIFGLKWSDIDFDNHKLSISTTMVRFNEYLIKEPKSDSGRRSIFIDKYIIELLKEWYKGGCEYVIKGYKPDSYKKHFTKLLKALELPNIRLHDLRHYNAIMMMNLGIPDKIASGRLGHAQVSTTREVYQHYTNEADLLAGNIIGNKKFDNLDNHFDNH